MTKADTQTIVTLVVALLVLFGIGYLGIRPLWGTFNRQRAEQAKVSAERKTLEEREKTLTRLAADQDEIEELGSRALIYLPTEVNAGAYIVDLEAMSGRLGIGIPNISFQGGSAKSSGEGLSEHPVNITAGGSWPQVSAFLKALEENLRFVNITTLNISEQEGSLQVKLAGVIYSKKDDGKYKDTSLTIESSLENLLLGREPFGGGIGVAGPGKPDPFAGF